MEKLDFLSGDNNPIEFELNKINRALKLARALNLDLQL